MVRIFSTVFLSSFVGALPYLLAAVVTSGLIQVFVSRATIQRVLPRNPWLAVFVVPFLGFILPLCECGVIPVAGRLVRKGVPLAAAVTFMLSNPILNPFPLLSTRTAFAFYPSMVGWRMAGAYGIAVTIGLVILVVSRIDPAVFRVRTYRGGGMWEVLDEQAAAGERSLPERAGDALAHAAAEFYYVGRFFILGSFAAAGKKVLVPRELLVQLAGSEALAVGGMMGFAFLIAVCSEVDAFVASGFLGTLPPGALLAFLLFGPMVDIKNTMMMLTAFPKATVVRLIALILVLVFTLGLGANLFMLR